MFVFVEDHDFKGVATTASDADGAVGVELTHWYIAIVSPRSEKKSANSLQNLGFETYVAVQKELHRWKNGRKKELERVVLPSMVFVRTNEVERKQFLVNLPFIRRFMVDPARRNCSSSPVALIPDDQLKTLKYMLENSEAPITIGNNVFRSGDTVCVVGGKLDGLKGIVQRSEEGKSRLFVSLDILGYAMVEIDKRYLRLFNT